ncbi:MAG: methyltransferase domain-containing protein [Bdellovibrionaceae bacterium]|nr:methyltransferase domain-containing protein [Pseudobdellovibrionaceae bacterium]
MTSTNKSSYHFEQLEKKEIEASFLKQRSNLRLDGFIDLLKRHHFPSQGKILEIGCGQGIRTKLMAQNFSMTEVIGFDRSHELLEEAKTFSKDVPNISWQQGDLYQLPYPENYFDGIYLRLVFMHLSEPLLALNEIKRVLKPDGVLLIEDADRECMFFEPAPKSFELFWSRIQQAQRDLGGDPNIGRKLSYLMKKVNFRSVHSEVQPIVGDGNDITFLLRTLMPSLILYLNPKYREEAEMALNDLYQMAQLPEASFYHFWFVVSSRK